MKTDLTKMTDEAAAPLVEKRLGVTMEDTGGGCLAFVFYGSQNGKDTDLYFGWMNGPLEFNLMGDEGGTLIEAGSCPEGSDADAQADFIMEHCSRLGFKVEETKCP